MMSQQINDYLDGLLTASLQHEVTATEAKACVHTWLPAPPAAEAVTLRVVGVLILGAPRHPSRELTRT